MRRVVLLFAVLVAVVPVAVASAPAASFKRCADVGSGSPSAHTRTNGLFAEGTGCLTARRVARRWMKTARGRSSVRVLGFACSGGADGVSCRRGTRHVTWGWYDD